MAQVKRTPSRLFVAGLGAACALLPSAPSAWALAPAVLTIVPGHGGEATQDGGAGNEQPTVVSVTDAEGRRDVVVISMSSDVATEYQEYIDAWFTRTYDRWKAGTCVP